MQNPNSVLVLLGLGIALLGVWLFLGAAERVVIIGASLPLSIWSIGLAMGPARRGPHLTAARRLMAAGIARQPDHMLHTAS